MADKLNELLEELRKILGCPYVSDLHSACKGVNATAKKMILSIPEQRYPLDTWNHALGYIMDAQEKSSSILEAKNKIARDK